MNVATPAHGPRRVTITCERIRFVSRDACLQSFARSTARRNTCFFKFLQPLFLSKNSDNHLRLCDSAHLLLQILEIDA